MRLTEIEWTSYRFRYGGGPVGPNLLGHPVARTEVGSAHVIRTTGGGLVFADVYTRFAAYFLDGALLAALISIPPTVLGLYDYASTYPPEPMPRATFVGTTIFGLAIQAAYFLWFWTGGRRATPGQRVFGLQVGNAFDGQPLTMTQAITRWLAMGWSWAGAGAGAIAGDGAAAGARSAGRGGGKGASPGPAGASSSAVAASAAGGVGAGALRPVWRLSGHAEPLMLRMPGDCAASGATRPSPSVGAREATHNRRASATRPGRRRAGCGRWDAETVIAAHLSHA